SSIRSIVLLRWSSSSKRCSSLSSRLSSITRPSGHDARRRCRETHLQYAIFHFGTLRRRVQQQAGQDEITAPRADLQHELVAVARQRHVVLGREGQLERQDVAAVLAR